MALTHNLGFPRIGAKRELKFALESYWQGQIRRDALLAVGAELRRQHWQQQAALDWQPVGDFSFYDHVLDMSFALGNVPERARQFDGDSLDNYFRVARGRSAVSADDLCCHSIAASEMTKWFNSNYHYIVPEFRADTTFVADPSRLLAHISEAKKQGAKVKPVIIGPITYLWLGKTKDASDRLALLPALLSAYRTLLSALREHGITWLQIDEPILATDLSSSWQSAFITAYHDLQETKLKILLTTYFGTLGENLSLLTQLPVAGIHLDLVNAAEDLPALLENLKPEQVLSLGVIDGRNIWKTDLNKTLDLLEPIHLRLGDRLWLAPSCSLLHVPVDLNNETQIDNEVKSWFSFALQKLQELQILATALNKGRAVVSSHLAENAEALALRRQSSRVHNPSVRSAVVAADFKLQKRQSPYAVRAQKQSQWLKLPLYPTTTIGSFPQTNDIRQARRQFKSNHISETDYVLAMKKEIAHSINMQEQLGLDVLVHGEAERNDMVEYFGEQLQGYVFSQFGWVQSYGSRCVKPPIILGDISRPKTMTVAWSQYAQTLSKKPIKGMLTGPVTMLNWSFVRDDIPRSITCLQLALAIRQEVLDLEKSGIRVIQIDEPALREGLPLRRADWESYLDWSVAAFRVAANGVADETQIHTHMCYCEFNDIIESIAALDADVITIETSRSDMELLHAFDRFNYPNAIGPGVYDIHSPNIPSVEQVVQLMSKAAERIPSARLWVNPDCGLKTRTWDEVTPALSNMVNAAKLLRERRVG